jgi:hypothetical protein
MVRKAYGGLLSGRKYGMIKLIVKHETFIHMLQRVII